MEKGFFRVDGKFYTFMSKVVDLAFVALLWIVGCLPVVTIITSTASMYQTVVKCIRYESGGVWSAFKEAYLVNLRQGVALTLFYGLAGGILAWADYIVFFYSTGKSFLFLVISMSLLMLNAVYVLNVLWIAPVFSRFSNSFGNILKLNYVIAGRNLIRTIPVLAVVVIMVVIFLAWNELFVILPALGALVNSYFVEPALRKFMPPQEEDNGDWRYGFA